MRKNASFSIAATILVLTTIFWAASGATKADKIGLAHYSLTTLLTAQLEPIW
jgi:hypothetical protein